MPRPVPTRRAQYRAHLPITTRWMDNDVFGHVNNVAYYSFFDTAVCTFLVGRGLLLSAEPHMMVVAESGCRFHSELAFPDAVVTGLRVARIGTSSVRYEIGVFRGEDDIAAADGFFVHVCLDHATRRPAPLPPHWRAELSTLMEE